MSPVALVSRVLAAIFGCYAFVWGVVALGVALVQVLIGWQPVCGGSGWYWRWAAS